MTAAMTQVPVPTASTTGSKGNCCNPNVKAISVKLFLGAKIRKTFQFQNPLQGLQTQKLKKLFGSLSVRHFFVRQVFISMFANPYCIVYVFSYK